MSSAQAAFQQFLAEYGPAAGERGPERFVIEVLGVVPDDWQLVVLRAYGRSERRIAASSCHGVGKTAVLSWVILYQLLTCYPQKAVATAPTASQIYDALFAEVVKWVRRLPPALAELLEPKSDRIELRASPQESFFSVRTSRAEKPEALQGIHSDGRVLLIGDESSGIPEAIFEAAAGSMSGHWATTVLTSNPVRTSGMFFDVFHKLRDMWFTVRVCAGPAVALEDREPGIFYSTRVSRDFCQDIGRRYGFDSNAYRVRVLGLFPKADDDTVIPFELVELARQRDVIAPPSMRPVWGLDVARFGDDASALVVRNRIAVTDVLVWKRIDTMQLTGRVKARWDELQPHARPTSVLVDAIGYGAGVADRLRELGLPCRAINVSENAGAAEKYRNLRSELWFLAREWLATRTSKLPTGNDRGGEDPAEVLSTELVGPRYGYTSTGRLLVESKQDMKHRGLPSPNTADAFCLTFAEEPATLVHGGRWASNWNEPITRKLGGIV